MMRRQVVWFLLLGVMSTSRLAAAQECPPVGISVADLVALQRRDFNADEATRAMLARGLVPCLANADPFLRDDVAATALARWLRAGVIPHPLRQQLTDDALVLVTRPSDGLGFLPSFATLFLSEVVRADRLDPALTHETLEAIARAILRRLPLIRDYRGYDAREGWRHEVAHSADLVLQLGLHPALGPQRIRQLLGALTTQVAASNGSIFETAEPERLARAAIFIYDRGILPADFWDAWLRALVDPGQFGTWQEAILSADGRARRLNILGFLHALGFAARVARPNPHVALLQIVDREISRIIAS